jgi:hypothetical protein
LISGEKKQNKMATMKGFKFDLAHNCENGSFSETTQMLDCSLWPYFSYISMLCLFVLLTADLILTIY